MIAPTLRRIADARELLSVSSLDSITVYEIHGRQIGDPLDRGETPGGEPKMELEFSERHSSIYLENRFKLSFADGESEYVVDLSSVFNFDEPVALTPDVIAEFAEKVGFMAAFPYLREAVGTTATRLGRPAPLIGLMQPGDFKIDPVSPSATAENN